MKKLFFGFLVACGSDGSGDPPPDGVEDPDPLTSITTAAAPGSLDDLHERIIVRRCSGEPGLCHNGQFEPNLSTPALTFAYVVNRPGIEKADRLRVKPGDADASLFIDKIKGRNGVATQMPLGAAPLATIAAQIRAAHGPSGPNREYVLRLAEALRALDASDSEVDAIAALIA